MDFPRTVSGPYRRLALKAMPHRVQVLRPFDYSCYFDVEAERPVPLSVVAALEASLTNGFSLAASQNKSCGNPSSSYILRRHTDAAAALNDAWFDGAAACATACCVCCGVGTSARVL